ncbi:hypothetical protein RBU49_03800 [Clostridium sp. MB40-C1]|uniref:hypothetical protein n=1 Tax=Clostridium sp. MB40-C1 TaxID=3070996 RepID=UPI0027E1C68C|nr:hypothetical protein [Clostridium sp. MB40-C1]WMJ81392.1 hypothetical protein RBU49_03800 [Clostridium sp. MB40-C1]
MLNIESIKTSRIKDCIKYELGENEYEKHREYLLSRLKAYLVNELSDIDEECLHNLLINKENEVIKYEKSYVKYDREKKIVILFIYQNTYKTYRREYYEVELNKEGTKQIVFKYLKTD